MRIRITMRGLTEARCRCMSTGLAPAAGSCIRSKVGFAVGPRASSSVEGDSKSAARTPSSCPALPAAAGAYQYA